MREGIKAEAHAYQQMLLPIFILTPILLHEAQKLPTALFPKYQLSYILQFGVLIKVYTASASFQKHN